MEIIELVLVEKKKDLFASSVSSVVNLLVNKSLLV
jgi:hypothetical protein